MKLEKDSKLVMIGDSITDCDRSRPVGEGLFQAVGKGYVMMVDALLGASYPDLGIRVVNMGISGNTVRDLDRRWQTDVIDLKPDWLSIMIGDNDVWRQFDSPTQTEWHVYPAEYKATLEKLVEQSLPKVKGLVLMTPFYIEPSKTDAMRAKMDEYGAIVKEISEKHNTLFVDTQAAFDKALETYYSATLGWDRVHPTHVGHAIIARAFLKSLSFEF